MWTHLYDFLLKAVVAVVPFIALMNIPFLEKNYSVFLASYFSFNLISYFGFARTLSSWLYCRLTLKMDVTWKEAKALNNALSPISFQEWLPMKEIKKMPKESRYGEAMQTYLTWKENKRKKRTELIDKFKGFSIKNKVINVLAFIWMLVAFVLSILNMPPASYITDFYTKLFDADEYYPMLNAIILFIPAILIPYLLKKMGWADLL